MKPDELNRLRFACNCCVVETGGHTVLIETGMGNRLSPMELSRMNMPEQLPPLPDILADGDRPERIDLVINTHLHFDHCGGNTIAHDGVSSQRFPVRATSRSAANGSMRTNAIRAILSATATAITIRWSSPAGWSC